MEYPTIPLSITEPSPDIVVSLTILEIVVLLIAVVILAGIMNVTRQLGVIQRNLRTEIPMVRESFEELKGAVEHATTVKEAALVLIKEMGDRLTQIADHPTPEEIRALAEHLRHHADALADGIADHDE